MPNHELDIKALPGPAQAVWNETYQTAVRTLRESGVDAVLVNTRARRAADTQVGLYWEWDEYRLKWQPKHSQPYTGKSVELVWDETKHPRWAVGTGVGPGGEGGGRFKPKIGGAGGEKKEEDEEDPAEADEDALMTDEELDAYINSTVRGGKRYENMRGHYADDYDAREYFRHIVETRFDGELPDTLKERLWHVGVESINEPNAPDAVRGSFNEGSISIMTNTAIVKGDMEEAYGVGVHEIGHALSVDVAESNVVGSDKFRADIDRIYRRRLSEVESHSTIAVWGSKEFKDEIKSVSRRSSIVETEHGFTVRGMSDPAYRELNKISTSNRPKYYMSAYSYYNPHEMVAEAFKITYNDKKPEKVDPELLQIVKKLRNGEI